VVEVDVPEARLSKIKPTVLRGHTGSGPERPLKVGLISLQMNRAKSTATVKVSLSERSDSTRGLTCVHGLASSGEESTTGFAINPQRKLVAQSAVVDRNGEGLWVVREQAFRSKRSSGCHAAIARRS
jgi:hypothetical protein